MLRKICFTLGIAVLFSLFFIPQVSHAEDGQTYKVNGTTVNVRTAASTDSDVIGKLHEGDEIDIFQESHGWLQTYYNDQEAWVASQFMTPADSDSQSNITASSKETITAPSSKVRIRTGPGTEYSIIGQTTEGETYPLLETTNDWYKVTLEDGQTGWIASWLTGDPEQENAQGKTETEDHGQQTEQVEPDTKNNKPQEEQADTEAPANGTLEGYTVVLDPGHGGKDPGSSAQDGTYEKDYTLSVANKVAAKLQNAGANVIETRTDDTFVSLQNRVNISGTNNANAFISLHFNAYPESTINGFSTHYYAAEDSRLAQDVQSALSRNMVLSSRGITKSDYHVLRENSEPAILIELGFITNTNDLANIQTDYYQNAVADGVTEGLINYFQN